MTAIKGNSVCGSLGALAMLVGYLRGGGGKGGGGGRGERERDT